MIYLDNNATTNMPTAVCKEMISWCNMGNPSAGYASAKRCQRMMIDFKKDIAKLCGFDWNCDTAITPRQYQIIFTSGASESNSMIITRVVDSYWAAGNEPHIVCSAIEHKSIILAIDYYVAARRCTVTYVDPRADGTIDPAAIDAAIQANTALVCVMYANNEIGSVNDIRAIGAAAHAHKVPFYCDAVQAFGKYGVRAIDDGVDGFAVSFHKLGGPVGCGLLVIKREWIEGYGLKALIFGTQNSGLRGGTENIPAIAASKLALTIAMKDRTAKNKKLLSLKHYICSELKARAPHRDYADYLRVSNIRGAKLVLPEVEIVYFDDNKARYLENTIFLSIVKRSQPPMCNTRFKEMLEQNGTIISVGSACNTQSSKASHVLYAMGADEYIRKGALRITLGDYNTKEECHAFVKQFLKILANCVTQNHLVK